jgi:hypothetical protein
MTGISPRIGVGVKLFDESYIQTGFLSGFSHCRRLQALSVIDKTSGDGPPRWKIFPFYQDDASAGHLSDNIHGQQRVTKFSTHALSLA